MSTALYYCLLRLRKVTHSKGQQDTAQHRSAAERCCHSLELQVKAIAAHVFKCWFDPLCVSQQARTMSTFFEPAEAKAQGSRLCCPRVFMLLQTQYSSIHPFSLTHLCLGWKSFFCKDVGVWSEFTYLVEKMLNMLILMFSSLHVLLMTVTCRHQFKGKPSPMKDSHLWKTRGLSSFLSISTCLSSSPNHAIPPLCHAGFSPMSISISTSTW